MNVPAPVTTCCPPANEQADLRPIEGPEADEALAILVRRRESEARFHAEVRDLASRVALVAWSNQEHQTRLDLVGAAEADRREQALRRN